MKAPSGSIVSLYYDSRRIINIGDVLQTRTGRCYLITELRRQRVGRFIGRWHIKALVLDKLPENCTVHPIIWYKRGKK